MNKSIPAFVLGLIFSIIGGICSYFFWLILTLISIATTGATQWILTYAPLINLFTFMLSFIGCFFCIAKAKVGGIIMLIASIISLICFITVFIISKTFNAIVLLTIPTIAILIASIIALKKKKVLD